MNRGVWFQSTKETFLTILNMLCVIIGIALVSFCLFILVILGLFNLTIYSVAWVYILLAVQSITTQVVRAFLVQTMRDGLLR